MMKSIGLLFSSASLIFIGSYKAHLKRVFFLVTCLIRWKTVAKLLSSQAPLSWKETIELRPDSLGVITWPYISNAWSPAERARTLLSHHAVLSKEPFLRIKVGDQTKLVALDSFFGELTVVMDRPRWFMREGELSLNLFVGQERIYSIAFCFSCELEKRVAYVGGIQGRNLPEIMPLYHELTKTMHGCRPRDLLIHIFLEFCKRFSVDSVFCVAEAYRHHKHPYFGASHKSSNSSNYDEIWTDRGGVLEKEGFYTLKPTKEWKRDISEIPAKKRSLYRKRYDLLDQISILMTHALRAGA